LLRRVIRLLSRAAGLQAVLLAPVHRLCARRHPSLRGSLRGSGAGLTHGTGATSRWRRTPAGSEPLSMATCATWIP